LWVPQGGLNRSFCPSPRTTAGGVQPRFPATSLAGWSWWKLITKIVRSCSVSRRLVTHPGPNPQKLPMITNQQSGTNVYEIAAGIYRIPRYAANHLTP
jgi:hypothetical protein